MSSTTNTLANKYSAKSFFKFNFRQNIQHLILYLIVAVLVMVLPTVMAVDNYYELYNEYGNDPYNNLERGIEDAVRVLGYIGICVSGGIAVLSGMSSLTHVNSKQNIGCYHSFPLRRETMYFIDSLTRTIYYGITMLFGYIAAYAILIVALPSDSVIAYFALLIRFIIIGVLAFMLIYSAFLLAAGLTGTAFMRFMMVIAIFFLPLIVYAIFVAMFMLADNDLQSSYYLSEDMIQYLCSPVRAVMDADVLVDGGKWFRLLLVIPESITYYIGGLLLHKFRKTEATGTTIIWKPVWNVLKYTIIVSCTLLGAYIFEASENNALAFFVGALIGAVLSLLLTNALFYRSSRAMFKGLKPFGICCAAVLVFMLFVPLNITGKIGDLYSAGNTKELTLQIGNINGELTFDDPEDISAVIAMLEDEKMMYSDIEIPDVPLLDPRDDPDYELIDVDYLITGHYYYSEMSEDELKKYIAESERYMYEPTYNITLLQKPKFGIPLCKRITASANSTFSYELVRTDEYAELMNVTSWLDTSKLTEIDIELDSREFSVGRGNSGYYMNNDLHYSVEKLDGLWDKAVSVLSLTGFDESIHEGSPIVGTIRLYYNYNNNGGIKSFNYPIYAEDIDMLNAVSEMFFLIEDDYTKSDEKRQAYSSSEEYYLDAIENIEGKSSFILMINTETGETKKISEEELAGLGRYTTSFVTENSWYWSSLERMSDNKYILLYQRDERYDLTIHFRTNAISDEELDAIFEEIG